MMCRSRSIQQIISVLVFFSITVCANVNKRNKPRVYDRIRYTTSTAINAIIEGRCFDRKTGNAVVGCFVGDGKFWGAVSDSMGNYILTLHLRGHHILHTYHPYYEAVSLSIFVQEGEILCKNFNMEPLSYIDGEYGIITGRVIDSRNDLPIIAVDVTAAPDVSGTLLGVSTRSNGGYVIYNVPPGIYTCTAVYVAYDEQLKSGITVRSNEITIVDFNLKPMEVKVSK